MLTLADAERLEKYAWYPPGVSYGMVGYIEDSMIVRKDLEIATSEGCVHFQMVHTTWGVSIRGRGASFWAVQLLKLVYL